MDVATGPALERPGGETPDIGPDVQDHGRAVPIGNVVFPAQDLLDVGAHGCWIFEFHRARVGLLVGGDSLELPTSWV